MIDDYFSLVDVDVNSPFYVKITRGEWTVPPTYMDAGAKQSGGAGATDDSDILIAVDISDDGYTPDNTTGLREATGYATHAYVALDSTTPKLIFDGGGTGVGAEHGVESADGTVDVKVLMDWIYDIPGTYAITLTLSLSENSN